MWFTDENVLTAATTRSPQNDRVCCVNRRDVVLERLLRTRWTFNNSLMVSVGVSKLWRTQLILVDPGMKINGTTTVMFFSHSAATVCRARDLGRRSRETSSCCNQDTDPAHRARDTIKLLEQETPTFTAPDLCPPTVRMI